ncbi:unnamed protein product [Anisakis simplex]|uniref:Uncharacterized protein n=1 Tax=Anisakis simplex TaxID=6269 RepID=A0A0M3JAH5_ANISI|nr:unnamed protein product [Anisakis simplex]
MSTTNEPVSFTNTSGQKDLVDIEAIVLNWAKQIFEITKTRDEARISKKHLQVIHSNTYHQRTRILIE